jgi:peptidoglycan/LPS O-acetylase OafA/YrhL
MLQNIRNFILEWLTKKFELSRASDMQNVRPMEGLRGFAVFLVFLVHYATLIKPWISAESITFQISNIIHSVGNVGVDLFFILSGYLIYGSLISKSQNFFKFMLRRIKRIYPTFTVVFIIYIVLSFVFPIENKIPIQALDKFIYLTQNFLLLPGIFHIEPMITVAWSLSYEMFYYLAIPLMITLFKLRNREIVWRVFFFLSLTLAIVIYCSIYGGHIRLIMFISGILLYEASKNNFYTPNCFIGFMALVIGLSSSLLPTDNFIKTSILFASFFILCLICFRTPSSWLPLAFSWKPLRWLGNMSYSYYLLHGLTLKACFLLLTKFSLFTTSHDFYLFWGLLPMMFIITLIPTSVLFLVIERPFSLVNSKVVSQIH